MRDTQLLLTTSIFPSFELEYITLNRHCRSTCQCHSYFISHKKKVFPSLGFSLFLYPLLRWLGSPFLPLTLISLQFALSIQWAVPLYGSWDQIRFTSGLNVCSHGLLHLKGNSFSWNFAVQFETRLMLANFTPSFFQNVSSIARTNCWRTKGLCHFVMVMSGLFRNNTMKEKSY